jgi:hypothetical protein
LHDAVVVTVKKTLLPQKSAIHQAVKEIELATKERKEHKENKQYEFFSLCSLRSFVAKILSQNTRRFGCCLFGLAAHHVFFNLEFEAAEIDQ